MDERPAPLPAVARADAAARERTLARLRLDVAELTRHGDRAAGGPGHAAALAFLARRLADHALLPYLGYDGYRAPYGSQLTNLLAVIPGADRHRRPIVLAAHFDGRRGSPGAGDNAAAVAVALAAVPRLEAAALDRGVVVALLDDGAPPRHRDTATGATVLLGHQRRHDVKAAVVLDRLGRRDAEPRTPSAVFLTGAESDARLPAVVAEAGDEALRLLPVHRRYRHDVPASEAFWEAKVPYLELYGGRWAGHGTPYDTPAQLDFDLLASIVDVVEIIVRRLDGIRLPGPFEGYDSGPFEAAGLRAGLGDAFPAGEHGVLRPTIDAAVRTLDHRLTG
jgi:hypothetical protein